MGATFTPNGSFVLTCSQDNTAKLWDAMTGACFRTLEGHSCNLRSLHCDATGTMIVTASEDRTAKLWSCPEKKPDSNATQPRKKETLADFPPAFANQSGARTLNGHTDFVCWGSFAPDSEHVVTASWDDTAKIWNVITGECELTL